MTTTRKRLRGSLTARSRRVKNCARSSFAGDQGEQLLELIDDQDELGLIGGQHAFHGAAETAVVALQLLHQARRRVDRSPEQRRFQLFERVLAGSHLGDGPALGSRQDPFSHRRQQPREHERRLAAAARPDNRDQPLLGHPLDELLAHQLAAEEIESVGLGERPKTLVRVANPRRLVIRRTVAAHEGHAGRGRESRRLTQQHARELAQSRRRFDAEFLAEDLARLVEDVERFRLPPRAVQRKHELGAQLLTQGVFAHELFELAHQLPVSPQEEIGFDAALVRFQPKLLQAGDGRLGERLVTEVGQGRPPPERQRFPEQAGGRVGIATGEGSRPLVRQSLESRGVELIRVDPDQVARGAGL